MAVKELLLPPLNLSVMNRDVPVEIKTLSTAFSYPHSALGRIQLGFFTSAEGVQISPPHCILSDLALSSCLRTELLEKPHCPAVGRCLLATVGHLQRSYDSSAWTCWMLSTLSICFCLNLPKLMCHRDAFLKWRGSTRFTRVLLCSLGHLCSWSLCRDAIHSMMAQSSGTL